MEGEGVVESEGEGWEWWGLMERGWRRLMERCWTLSPSSSRINIVTHRCRLVVASPGRVVVIPCHCHWLLWSRPVSQRGGLGGRWDRGYLAGRFHLFVFVASRLRSWPVVCVHRWSVLMYIMVGGGCRVMVVVGDIVLSSLWWLMERKKECHML